MSLFGKIVQTFFKNYHPEPWRDSISWPINSGWQNWAIFRLIRDCLL
jgi:hypothetical protein